MSEEFEFSYSPKTFPFHPDHYEWPKATVPDVDTVLNIHCVRSVERRQFNLIGIIGADREDQIGQVIMQAQQANAEVIMFKGIGLSDEICNALMANMHEPLPHECPGQKIGLLRTDWPTRFQRRVLREAMDMSRHGDFHETSLAHRMRAPVDEIRGHLQLFSDLGLMKSMGENG
jgi:hypothetical protein